MKKILLICIVFVCAAGAVFWFILVRAKSSPLQGISPTAQSAASSLSAASPDAAPLATSSPPTEQVSADTRRYQNTQFHFSLIYPSELQVEEDKEQGGALTVTFQNADMSDGFEVYITPYAQSQVTQARFQADEPSGVMTDPTAIVVAGTPATMFFGNNTLMGDTREVWFIHNGFLYEVATYKNLDSWLSNIMSTWKFL